MSGVFVQILMTRTLDLVTGSNLKRWLQQDNLLRSQVAQATTQTQAEQNCSSNYGPEFTSYCIAESQEHTAWIKICEELNPRMITKAWVALERILFVLPKIGSKLELFLMRPLRAKFGKMCQ